MEKVPAKIGFTILIHKNADDVLKAKLAQEYANSIVVTYVKNILENYIVYELREIEDNKIDIVSLWKLPILAMREELTTYVYIRGEGVLSQLTHDSALLADSDVGWYLITTMLTAYEKATIMLVGESYSEIRYYDENDRLLHITKASDKMDRTKILASIFEATYVRLETDNSSIKYKISKEMLKTNFKIGVLKK